jgi:hypothetical protein
VASEIFGEALGYDELGAHRHLVVSERLRLRRRTLGLTQKEVVARLRRLGVTTTNKSLSSLEHGAGLDVGKLPELARALDCTLTYLVGLTDDPERWEPDSGVWPNGGRTRVGTVSSAPPSPRPAPLECPAILGPLDPPRRRA